MMRVELTVGFLALAASTALTLAQDQSAPPAGGAATNPPGALPQMCMSSGTPYQVGQYACIPACHGMRRLARCDAAGDNVSWTFVSNECPSAMINAPWPSDWSELPVAADMSPKPMAVNKSVPPPDAATLAFATFRS